MILTSTYTQIEFGSQVVLCTDVNSIKTDKDSISPTIVIFEKSANPSMYIRYQDITFYNGSSLIPPLADLITELELYSKGPVPIETENPQITVSATPPLDPAVNDIWIDVS